MDAKLLAPPGLNGHLHDLKFPRIEHRVGPTIADMRNVQVLTALDNFLAYARIPGKKVVATRKLMVWAIELDDQVSWNHIMLGLATETARDGFRSGQAVDVLIAEKQAKDRMEAFSKLAEMGPKPKDTA